MNRDQTGDELGRREFLRSAALLGTGVGVSALVGGCSDNGELLPSQPNNLVIGRKWIRLDTIDSDSGVFTSLDGFSDTSEDVFSSDVELSGHAILASGDIVPVTTIVDKECANSLSLRPLGGGRYSLESNGVPQPPGAPYEVHLIERTIPGTSVIVLTGYLIDPSTGTRVTFNVTHDPIVWVTVVIMIAGVLLLVKVAYGTGCSGRGGPKSIRVRVRNGGGGSNSVGVSLMSEPSGITAECTTSCNHDQGAGS